MSDRSGKPEIHAERGMDGKITHLVLSHCEACFDGANGLRVLNVDGTLKFSNISEGEVFTGQARCILDGEFSHLTLSECSITPGGQIDFRATTLLFEKCGVIGDSGYEAFSFLWVKFDNQILWTVSKLENGYLELSSDSGYVRASNICITWQFVSNPNIKLVVEIAEDKEAKFKLSKNDLKEFQIEAGTIELFKSTRRPISLFFRKGSSLKKLDIQTEALVFHEINSDSNECRVGVGGNADTLNLNLSHLHIKGIEISVGIEGFICNTCDFSETKLKFLGTSFFDLGTNSFKSIATVWNPNTITYRGFCPALPKNMTHQATIPAARQFFCEMKTYFSGKGDSITAGDFHAAEMVAHRRYLQLQKNPSYSDRVDRFILFASHYSSNFGQSLFRALVSYGLLGFLFSIILLCLMGDMCARCFADWHVSRNFDCNFFWVFLLNVLSPLNFKLTDIIPSGSGLFPNSFWAMSFWMMWKIIGSFLIFQIIASSRRFIRKW